MVDYYTRRIEEFLRRQQDVSTADEIWHGEEAILVSLLALYQGFYVFELKTNGVVKLLERKVTTPFFSMARAIVRTDFAHSTRAHTMDRIICLEEAVLVAGRVAARLVHSRLAVGSPPIPFIRIPS